METIKSVIRTVRSVMATLMKFADSRKMLCMELPIISMVVDSAIFITARLDKLPCAAQDM